MLLFHILLYIVIILDIPIIRQIVAFLYLSFVPGFVLIKLLKLSGTMLVEKLLLIVGLSLAFLMFAGLLINELFFALNISMPLSSTPLLIFLSFLMLFLSIAAFRQDISSNLRQSNIIPNLKSLAIKSVLIIPLGLGIVG